jgi:hypothetical protein
MIIQEIFNTVNASTQAVQPFLWQVAIGLFNGSSEEAFALARVSSLKTDASGSPRRHPMAANCSAVSPFSCLMSMPLVETFNMKSRTTLWWYLRIQIYI